MWFRDTSFSDTTSSKFTYRFCRSFSQRDEHVVDQWCFHIPRVPKWPLSVGQFIHGIILQSFLEMTSINMYTCIHVYMYPCIHVYMDTYMDTCMDTYIHTLHYITLHYITLHYITLHIYIYIYTRSSPMKSYKIIPKNHVHHPSISLDLFSREHQNRKNHLFSFDLYQGVSIVMGVRRARWMLYNGASHL